MDKNHPIIINMNSGSAQKKYKEVKRELASEFTFKVKNAKDFKAAYDKVLKLKPEVVVLAGGDGTIIKGIESLTQLNYKGNFGILPFGTANYLARELGISLDPSKALQIIKAGKSKKVPLARANNNLFALVMTIGITRAVSSNVSDDLKQKIGQAAYFAEFLRQSKVHKPFEYQILLNNKKKLKGKTHQLLVYNVDLNQQIKFTPEHKLTDSSVKLLLPRSGAGILRLYSIFLLHIVTLGRVKRDMKSYTAKKITIKTKPALPAEFDGEITEEKVYKITASAELVDMLC